MAREQVTTVHRRQAGGGHVTCAPAAGRVSHPSTHVHAKLSPHARTRWRKHPCKLVPQSSLRGHCCRKRGPVLARSLCVTASQPWVTVFSEKTVVLQQSFKYFVLPKALKPYKKLQKCQKLLENFSSENSVGRPKNYQAKVPGTVSRTKRSADFSPPQVKHCRVQENYQIEHVWVSFHMFWRPIFFIDENCKITEPMHFWTWALLRAFCTTFRRKRFIART